MMGIDIKAKFARPSCFLGSNANATKVNIVINAIIMVIRLEQEVRQLTEYCMNCAQI